MVARNAIILRIYEILVFFFPLYRHYLISPFPLDLNGPFFFCVVFGFIALQIVFSFAILSSFLPSFLFLSDFFFSEVSFFFFLMGPSLTFLFLFTLIMELYIVTQVDLFIDSLRFFFSGVLMNGSFLSNKTLSLLHPLFFFLRVYSFSL